jgi:hypothetical protein
MPGVLRARSLPARLRCAGPLLGFALLAAPAAALDLEVIDTATGQRVEPEGVIDLALVRAGAVGQRVFRVVNREPGPLAVHGCQLVNEKGTAFALRRCLVPPRESVALLQPGMSGRFAVEWRSDTPGRFSATVRLEPGLFSFRVVARVSDVVDWHEVIDLGRVRADHSQQRRFSYANTRDRPLRVAITVEGEAFRMTRPPPDQVEPGREGTFDLALAAKRPGTVESKVFAHNVDSGALVLEFTMRATVLAVPPGEEQGEQPSDDPSTADPRPPAASAGPG